MPTFGPDPKEATFNVSAAADFTMLFRNTVEDWPDGTLFELRFEGGPIYTATLDGTDATISVDKALIASEVINVGIRTARIFYVSGTDDVYLYGPGTLTRNVVVVR